MLNLCPDRPDGEPLRLLCIGAHSDDIEIGCGGTLRQWLDEGRYLHVTWVVLAARGARAAENRRSARALLKRAASLELVEGGFTDGFLPAELSDVKQLFEQVKGRVQPDIVFTHRLEDRHQDHRVAAELTWNTFRDHLVLEYEIPKYEGDLSTPNAYVPLSARAAAGKVRHLLNHFGSQRSKDWFTPDTFMALMRLRGLECRAPAGLAEGFHARKFRLTPGA